MDCSGMDRAERDRRARRREFIRTHHPDVGGDPTKFVAGLARFDYAPFHLPYGQSARVVIVPSRRWPVSAANLALRRIRRRGRPPRVR